MLFRSEERYTEEADGRVVTLVREDALRAHFDGRSVRLVGFETAASIEARKQAEAQQRQADTRRAEQEAQARRREQEAAARNAARSASPTPAPSSASPSQAPAPARRVIHGE